MGYGLAAAGGSPSLRASWLFEERCDGSNPAFRGRAQYAPLLCQCCPGGSSRWELRAAGKARGAVKTPRRRPDDSLERYRAGSRPGSGVRVPSSGTKRRAVNWPRRPRSAP